MSQKPTSPPNRSGSTVGRFHVREILGRARDAEIYRAFDPDQQRDVALKIFDASLDGSSGALDCFHQEAAALLALTHPNLARLYACDHEGETYYLAMDLLRGPTLRDLLTAQPAGLPRERVLAIFHPVAQAIAHAHLHGVVHGGLKPDNVIIRSDGAPVVAGFGLPCLRTDGSPGQDLEVGYLTYLAPERITHHTQTAQSDIYSLGILLYEMVTGDVPFRGSTREELTYQHLYAVPQPPGQIRVGLDPRIEQTALKALAKNPRDRYATVADLLHDLDQGALAGKYETVAFDKEAAREVRRQQAEFLRDRPPSIPAPAPAGPDALPRTANRLPVLIAVVLLIAAVAVAALLLAGV